MASITREANGRRKIRFISVAGKRKPIRLGKITQRTAEAMKVRIENLVSAAITGHALDDETSRWVAGIDEFMANKLVAAKLIPKRESLRLKPFLDAYIKTRCDTKASTRIVYGHTRRNLISFFGADKPIRQITQGDADEWRLSLIKQGLADNTVRRRSGIAKQFFNAALRKSLITKNPFADLKAAVQANASRMYFITRKETKAVIDACPDAQWRLLFALSRYGGLRCPSEHLALRWSDVDWQRNRITIHSPKTEHHLGGESRQIPLFPELLPYLREVFEEAEPGTTHVITRYRDANANLRTQLYRIISKAGLIPWPKLFQNLRSTRETELAEKYPLHVVCAWIGNSQPVAAKHYLQITDEHFQEAAKGQATLDYKPRQNEKSQQRALQNALQQTAASARTALHDKNHQIAKPTPCKEMRNDATPCKSKGLRRVGVTGLEPVTSSL